MKVISSLTLLGAVTVVSAGSSSEDNTECADGLCTTLKQHPYDADPSTDCFTVAAESIPKNGYKEIDFSRDYKPTNAYSCVDMPACDACTTIGKQAFKGSTLDRFYMPHTVDTFDEQAFKEIVTSTGDALEIVQLCDPADSSYTEITKDIRWAEKTDPVPNLIRSCPTNEGAAGSGLYEDFHDGVVYIKPSSSNDMNMGKNKADEKEEDDGDTMGASTKGMSPAADRPFFVATVGALGILTLLLV